MKDWINGSFLKDFDLVFRIDCRSVYGTLEAFLEKQVPEGNKKWNNTFSMKNQFKYFKVLWILDGYDEKSSDFNDFYRNLQLDFGGNHKFFITSRPNMTKTLRLEHFVDGEVMKILALTQNEVEHMVNCELGVTKSKDFYLILKAIETSKEHLIADYFADKEDNKDMNYVRQRLEECLPYQKSNLDLLRSPLMLKILIRLFHEDKLEGIHEIDCSKTYLLYHFIFDKKINSLAKRHRDKVTLSLDDFEELISNWVNQLCRIACEDLRDYKFYKVPKDRIEELKKSQNHVLVQFFLNTFLDFDSMTADYYYSHLTQQEALAARFMNDLSDLEILELFKPDTKSKVKDHLKSKHNQSLDHTEIESALKIHC